MKIQRPTKENNWLYEDKSENDRYFFKIALLADDASEFPECTDAEKEEWEREHPTPEPEPESE